MTQPLLQSRIRLSDGLYVIEIEYGDEDEGGESGVEAAVVEDEAAVHFRGDSADDCAQKSGEHAVAEAVLSRNRAKTCRECQAVDIRLSRECPRDVKACPPADENH